MVARLGELSIRSCENVIGRMEKTHAFFKWIVCNPILYALMLDKLDRIGTGNRPIGHRARQTENPIGLHDSERGLTPVDQCHKLLCTVELKVPAFAANGQLTVFQITLHRATIHDVPYEVAVGVRLNIENHEQTYAAYGYNINNACQVRRQSRGRQFRMQACTCAIPYCVSNRSSKLREEVVGMVDVAKGQRCTISYVIVCPCNE